MRKTPTLAFGLSLLLSISSGLFAEENPRNDPSLRQSAVHRFVLTPRHPLTGDEQAALRAEGVTFDHNLTGGRYLVRITGDSGEVEVNPTVASLEPFGAAQKIYHGAYAAAAQGRGRVIRLTVRFHDEVTLDDARSAVAAAGGELESPLGLGFDAVKELTVRIPSSSLSTMASDERVLVVGGPPLVKKPDNAVAAQISHVTDLYSAPYGLSGKGVALSIFELGTDSSTPPKNVSPDFSHPEFGGRYISHYPVAGTPTDAHGTHTGGTIVASGIQPAAKGMAFAATLHAFDAQQDIAVVLANKKTDVPATGSVADNNSWGFQSGWQPGSSLPIWYGAFAYIGGYDSLLAAPMDQIARQSTTLFVHSAGNDAINGLPGVVTTADFAPHRHVDDITGNVLSSETFCYSKDGTGKDCPTPTCSPGASTHSTDDNGNTLLHCETVQHPTYGPYNTMGTFASAKNVVAVGAADVTRSGVYLGIAYFSSRGPTRDGRVKPDLVAKGTNQYSTIPNATYGYNQGTSMSSPVVTGIAGVMVEQWRKTFNAVSPTPQQLKTLLIAGADDLGLLGEQNGPDFTFGFGLVNAKASADLIIADGGSGSRIRNGTLSVGQQLEYPLTVSSQQSNLRVVLGWADPEVLLAPPTDTTDPFADKTLVNDLDVKVIDPTGATVLPYTPNPNDPCISDQSKPCQVLRGVNKVDNTEEVEIKNAVAGTYRVVVKASTIGDTKKSTQDFVLIANAPLGAAAAPCTDPYEPNDTVASAYGDVASGTTISAKICSIADVDFFRFFPSAGTVRVRVTATDTPLTVTEFDASGNATSNTINVAVAQTADLTFNVTSARREYVSIKANGAAGATGTYNAQFTYSFSTPAHRHVVKR